MCHGRLTIGVAILAFVLGSGASTEVTAQSTIRVAAYNVKHGRGMDEVVDLERIAAVLRPLDADVITLQEIDFGTERTDRVDQAERLGALLGMTAHFGAFMSYQGGEYGMAVLSRLPVTHVENHRLPDGDEPRTALEVIVEVGVARERVSVVGIHFYRTPEERRAQAVALNRALEDREVPVILAGDFNSTPGDIVFDALLEATWHPVKKSGEVNTFPADRPEREIDFIMVRPGDRVEVVEHRVIRESVASDHRPLLAVLRIR